MNLSAIFEKNNLIPTVVQDAKTGEVLMLAYVNEESLQKTLESGRTWFFSRSRGKLWNKGETSGHIQQVEEILIDCDEDTLIFRVKQTGPACHTGSRSCFFRKINQEGEIENV